MVQQQKQYKFYDHNLSSLSQYLCITLVIKKKSSSSSSHVQAYLEMYKTFTQISEICVQKACHWVFCRLCDSRIYLNSL